MTVFSTEVYENPFIPIGADTVTVGDTVLFVLIIKPTRCTNFSVLFFGIKLYKFRTIPLSIIRSFSLYTQQWCMLYRFADSLRAGSGRNQFRPDPAPVSNSSSVHHQEFFTVHTALAYVIHVCWQLASRIKMEPVPSWSCSQAVSTPVWHIPLLCVQWKTPDDGQGNSPKHVEF